MNNDINRNHSQSGVYPGEPRRAHDARRTREIGNWGRASEHVGRRWEELGFERLGSMVGDHRPWPTGGRHPRAFVALMQDDTLQAMLMRIGLPSPDVVVVLGSPADDLILQALDFKWDIEFASYTQIRAAAVQALLQRDEGALNQAIIDAAGKAIRAEFCCDGLLFAPDSPANQRFLTSQANLRQEFPIEASEVILESVDPLDFFSLLPGWELAVRLAELDRSTHSLKGLEGADHYYRLGAGLLGAASQLQVSIFDSAPLAVDADQAIDFFRPLVRTLTSRTFIEQAERLMAVRSQLVARLRRLTRSPLRPGELTRAFAAKGIRLPERPESGPPSAERERWMQVQRRAGAEYRAVILRTGLRLVRTGLSDAETLGRLEADAGRFAIAARSFAHQLIEQMA